MKRLVDRERIRKNLNRRDVQSELMKMLRFFIFTFEAAIQADQEQILFLFFIEMAYIIKSIIATREFQRTSEFFPLIM